MKVIIVDDEKDTLEDICDAVREYEDFKVVGKYTNPLAAWNDIRKTEPDCAFLDIEMPGVNGLEFAEQLLDYNPEIKVVFITAFNYYATEAFEVNAMDYILKPIHPARFQKIIQRIREKQGNTGAVNDTRVTLYSLGCFEVHIGNTQIKWNRSKSKELLAYLLHHKGYRKVKYTICEDLWPEYEPKKALVNLQTAMYSLKKSLGDAGREAIRIDFSDEGYMLKLGNITWDAWEFESLYNQMKEKRELSSLKKAVKLYQGDYMGGEDWLWAQLTVESFALKYQELLKMLAEVSFEAENYNEAMETIMTFAKKQAPDIELQRIFSKAAFCWNGISGLNYQITRLRKLYKEEYDSDVDSAILDYCSEKGVKIS
ncbi:MAG: response regulator [Lacrimispora sp.]|uniref:response regulator n=1 Tax=Lacrimispora sp. TaxID=2719234 RepID=UPI0039E5E9B9